MLPHHSVPPLEIGHPLAAAIERGGQAHEHGRGDGKPSELTLAGQLDLHALLPGPQDGSAETQRRERHPQVQQQPGRCNDKRHRAEQQARPERGCEH